MAIHNSSIKCYRNATTVILKHLSCFRYPVRVQQDGVMKKNNINKRMNKNRLYHYCSNQLTYATESNNNNSMILSKSLYKSSSLNTNTKNIIKDKVCILGSGNWGSAIATIVGKNVELLSDYYETDVNMWVYEEDITLPDGTIDQLSNMINKTHENTKYLPGITIPNNVHAISNLEDACRNATVLLFILPHQFLTKLIPTIRQSIHPNQICRGVSLIKGIGKAEYWVG